MAGFFGDDRPSIYVELSDTPKYVRPLAKSAIAKWQHKIAGVKSMNAKGQVVDLRKFASEICTAQGRNSAGCYLCNQEDPFWSRLDAKEQYTQKGKVKHFGRSPAYLLPVWDQSVMDVRVLKGPQSLFADMAEWNQLGNDVMACDWAVSKTGSGLLTVYKCTRQDASLFQITPEIEALVTSIMADAEKDFEPSDPNYLRRLITGEALRDASGVPDVALPPATAQAALQAPPPPMLPPGVAVKQPITKDPAGFYALTTDNQWKLITDLKAAGVPGSELL